MNTAQKEFIDELCATVKRQIESEKQNAAYKKLIDANRIRIEGMAVTLNVTVNWQTGDVTLKKPVSCDLDEQQCREQHCDKSSCIFNTNK